MKKHSSSLSFRLGLFLAGIIIFISLTSLVYTPYNVIEVSSQTFASPSWRHLLGTDHLGRDTLSRIMTGGRYTLLVAGVTVASAAVIGVALGLIAGYIGGVIGELIMRVMDAISSFPGILLTVVAVSVLDYGKYTLIPALTILFIPSYTRIARSGALRLRGRDFIKSLRIMGASRAKIIFSHILPNIAGSIVSATAIGLSNAILAEASMSYLGFGIQPPVPSWGRMLAESQNNLFRSVLPALMPGLIIIITVAAFHLIGEGLYDAGE